MFSNIFSENTVANSNYNGLQVSLEKNFSHGLLFQASYTFSKAIDQGASFENELNPINPNATRGLSLLDAKNRFVFSPVWQLPIPKKDGFAGKVANGWQLSAIITYQSGFPIRIQDQDDAELQTSIFFESTNTPYTTAPLQRLNPKTNVGNYWFNAANFCDADGVDVLSTTTRNFREYTACAVLRAGAEQHGPGDCEDRHRSQKS